MPGIGFQPASFKDDDLYEGDEVSPNWNVSSGTPFLPDLTPNFQGTVSATVQVLESDPWGDNHYDSIPQGGNGETDDDLDVHVTLFAATGNLFQVVGASNWLIPVPNGFIGNFNKAGQDGFYLVTTGTRQKVDDNAQVTVSFRLTEL